MDLPVELGLVVTIKKEGGWYISSSPALDVHSQGRTQKEALDNLKEALELFVESCLERGVLDRVLKDCGFRPGTEPKKEEEVMVINVLIPPVAQHAENHPY
nr:type II toxin-antitoxin system HicB family antitoxin [Gammaproteobacteria bacterium]